MDEPSFPERATCLRLPAFKKDTRPGKRMSLSWVKTATAWDVWNWTFPFTCVFCGYSSDICQHLAWIHGSTVLSPIFAHFLFWFDKLYPVQLVSADGTHLSQLILFSVPFSVSVWLSKVRVKSVSAAAADTVSLEALLTVKKTKKLFCLLCHHLLAAKYSQHLGRWAARVYVCVVFGVRQEKKLSEAPTGKTLLWVNLEKHDERATERTKKQGQRHQNVCRDGEMWRTTE